MSRARFACVLSFLLVLTGCASSKVSDRKILVNEQIPRPKHIWVHDFVATPADIPADSGYSGHYSAHPTPQTSQEIALGRRIGGEIAAHLVDEIHALGMPANRYSSGVVPQINDLVIRGYLVSMSQGDEKERVMIGFGAGSSELKAAVEGFQVTPQGLRKLGSGSVDSGGSKGPGMLAPAAVAIATSNPLGLVVSGGMKAYEEESGSSKIDGRARAVAKEIAEQIEPRFKQQGWID